MNFVYFYLVGVASGVILALLSKNFYWSAVDEPPISVVNNRRVALKKILIWSLVFLSLFGHKTFVD